MNPAAFLSLAGVVKIVRRSIQLYLAFLTSSAQSVLIISPNCEHSVNMCLTHSSSSPHAHFVSSMLGTVMGWRPSLGLVGGLHSAMPRVVSRKAVAIGWLGFDDYG